MAVEKKPLAGVRVSLVGVVDQEVEARARVASPLASVVTAADGVFRFSAVAEGSNYVVFRPSGSLSDMLQKFHVVGGRECNAGDVAIQTGGTIRGKLVRAPGDAGVAGALITITTQPGSSETRTDNSGSFAFGDLARASYGVSAPDYELKTSVDLTVQGEAEVTLRLGGATLKGVVMRGTRPEAASIRFRRKAVTMRVDTRGDGTFEIKDLEPGTWNYEIRADILDRRGLREDSTTILGDMDIREGMNERRFDLPAGRITGRVADPSGKPVESADVRLKSVPESLEQQHMRDRHCRTLSDGTFEFSCLHTGTYELVASKQGGGYVPKVSVTVPEEGTSKPLELKLVTDTGTLVSVVIDKDTGKPVPEAKCVLNSRNVALADFSYGDVSDSSGRLEISGMPPGRWHLEVFAVSFVPERREVQIAAGQTVTLNIALAAAGEFRWTLKGPDGVPVPGVLCELICGDGSLSGFQPTDQKGTCVMAQLQPGAYTAKASPEGKNPISVPVTIVARQPTTLETKVE